MKFLDSLIGTPVAEALGWAVLHSIWEGGVIAAALALTLACVRSSRLRHAAGCIALLALAGAFVATWIRFLPEVQRNPGAQIHDTAQVWKQLPRLDFAQPGFNRFSALIPWLAPAWGCGVFLFYCRYAVAWFSSRQLRSRGVCCPKGAWQPIVTALAAELKITRPVVLLESLFSSAPVVMGHFRPVILVPLEFLTGLPGEHVEAVLLHELAHIRRADYLMNACQRLLEGLLFYHPAAWWISHVVRAERENCCDDLVVSVRKDVHLYASALAELERNRSTKWSLSQTAVAGNGGSLMKRIKRLLYPKTPSGIWAPGMTAVILLLGGSFLFGAWQMNTAVDPEAAESAAKNVAQPWQKWLNDDVVYIIADEEKKAFEHLTRDEERQHFVEQFWEVRNPTPGAATNAFKEEHYRRLAFANQHFQTASGTPGWQTDRGHIYIVYGPPDEIESHPKTAQSNYAMEAWRYRPGQALDKDQFFTFFDRIGNGDFRLGPANARTGS